MKKPSLLWTIAACSLVVSMLSAGRTSVAQDVQLENAPLKTLNDHFPFEVPDSVDQWNARREALRRRVLVANGLWPLPEKTELQPVIHGKIEREGFTVEKVYFQSLPGHFVSGMLFRPAPENQLGVVDGKRPAVLCPHGHGGRTMKLSDAALAKEIETGGEVFESSGRYPKLARCAQLARMGCVSFIFDMLGYADSQQVSYEIAHRHAEPRFEERDRTEPCFYSIEADLKLQTVMGLQTWNAIRSLDFLSELPEVDSDRLGVTGGSGGGTQTILLSAIDPRVQVAFPNGMVSTSMQGGCYCENCNYLRIGTGNVELAALFAPKPQGMTAADDWTKDMLTDGYPQLKQLYTMLGQPQNVICGDLLKYPHNYNHATRAIMYPWMAKHLGLPEETPLIESDFEAFTDAEMAVYDDDHPAPSVTGVEHERQVLKWWSDQNEQALAAVVPGAGGGDSADQLKQYRDVVGGAWRVIFDRDLPNADDLEVEQLSEKVEGDVRLRMVLVSHPKWQTAVQYAELSLAKAGASPKRVVVNPSHNGMQSRWTEQDALAGYVKNYPDSTVVIPFLQTPQLEDDQLVQPLINDSRTYSGFTFGYNRPLVVKRYDQLLCVLAASGADSSNIPMRLIGQFPAAIAAGVFAAEQVDELVLTNPGYRFANVRHYRDADFIPGAKKYFDLPGLVSLRAPHQVTFDSGDAFELVEKVYAAAGATDAIAVKGAE